MYKISKFHYCIKHKPKNILYNTLTGNISLVNDAFYNAYVALLTIPTINEINDELLNNFFGDTEIVNKMKENGLIIHDNFDELSVIRRYQDMIRCEDHSTNIEFVVTYACNFNCVYCYENKKEILMDSKVAAEAAEFVIDLAKQRQSKEMMVQFIGGEPLLNRKAIEIIVEKMFKFKEANKITMGTSLTTNGSLLEHADLAMLKRLGPLQVQITIDGPAKVHNTRRPMRGGNSYNAIVTNIKKLAQFIDELVIRINVDRDNFQQIPILLDELAQLNLTNTYLSIIPTFSHTDNCSHYHPSCFITNEFAPINVKLWRQAVDRRFIPSWVPTPTFISCGAVSPGAYAIDPCGDIYKCAAVYGNKNYTVGNIYKGINKSSKSLYATYIERDALAFEDKKCRECASLPICAGGCAHRAERAVGTMSAPDCRFDKKECVEDFARLYVDWHLQCGLPET